MGLHVGLTLSIPPHMPNHALQRTASSQVWAEISEFRRLLATDISGISPAVAELGSLGDFTHIQPPHQQ